MTILVINGPNLNILGKREIRHYGSLTLKEINSKLDKQAKSKNVKCLFFQSNHEGALIDFIQKNVTKAQGIIINPGALTHYGYSLHDALIDSALPIVEVHLSDINTREDFRKIDVFDGIVIKKISGHKEKGYTTGLQLLINHLRINLP